MKRVAIQVKTIIRRPPGTVFKFTSNYENDPEWRSGVISMTHDPKGPVHLGMKTHEEMRFFGRKIQVTAEIVAVESERLTSFRSLTGPIKVHGDRIFSSVKEGTLFTYTAVAELNGVFGLLSPIVVKSFMKRATGDIDRLRTILENS
jgi:hypothetical protein